MLSFKRGLNDERLARTRALRIADANVDADEGRSTRRDRHWESDSLKALVKQSAGPGLVLADVPEPAVRDDEVMIRVRRAGVCGTDVHIYEWNDWARNRVRAPIVVGHEFAVD